MNKEQLEMIGWILVFTGLGLIFLGLICLLTESFLVRSRYSDAPVHEYGFNQKRHIEIQTKIVLYGFPAVGERYFRETDPFPELAAAGDYTLCSRRIKMEKVGLKLIGDRATAPTEEYLKWLENQEK